MKLLELLNLLLEDKTDFLANQYKDKLISAAEKDSDMNFNDPTDIVKHLSTVDPSPRKLYLPFIVKCYANGDITTADFINVNEILSKFDKVKSILDKKDIGQYKSFSDVADIIKDDDEKDATSKRQKTKQIKYEGAEVVAEDGSVLILNILSEKAAVFYGAGTKWCTAAKEHNAFKQYKKDGNIYIILTGNAKYQVHVESGSFMNALDNHVSQKDISLLSKSSAYKNFIDMLCKTHSNELEEFADGSLGKSKLLIPFAFYDNPENIKLFKELFAENGTVSSQKVTLACIRFTNFNPEFANSVKDSGLVKFINIDEISKSTALYYVLAGGLPTDETIVELLGSGSAMDVSETIRMLVDIRENGSNIDEEDLNEKINFVVRMAAEINLYLKQADNICDCADTLILYNEFGIDPGEFINLVTERFDEICSWDPDIEAITMLYDALLNELTRGEKFPHFEKIILDDYVSDNSGLILQCIGSIYYYSYNVNNVQEPWPALFDTIIQEKDYGLLAITDINTTPPYEPIVKMMQEASPDVFVSAVQSNNLISFKLITDDVHDKIAKNPKASFNFAFYVSMRRFIKGEPAIATDPELADAYCTHFKIDISDLGKQ